MREEQLKARAIYHEHLKPNSLNIEAAINAGMIAKADLIDGKTYIGHCRNASRAVWNAEKNRFVYKRNKFGHVFDEYIVHPSDDYGFDIFVPVLMEKENE